MNATDLARNDHLVRTGVRDPSLRAWASQGVPAQLMADRWCCGVAAVQERLETMSLVSSGAPA